MVYCIQTYLFMIKKYHLDRIFIRGLLKSRIGRFIGFGVFLQRSELLKKLHFCNRIGSHWTDYVP